MPPKYNGHGPINHTGDIVYSDRDPTVVFGAAGGIIWRSSDSGETWKEIGKNGVNGFIVGTRQLHVGQSDADELHGAAHP